MAIPDGNNLFSIIESSESIKETISNYFNEYNLEIVLDVKTKRIEIQKKERNLVYKIPYYLIADTLLRLIFYTCAINSNEKSVLLFEEPETHSFPPYLNILNQHILDSTTNQFFIATHNPYIVTGLVEKTDASELSIFVMDNIKGEVTIRELSEKSINKITELGLSTFFNLDTL